MSSPFLYKAWVMASALIVPFAARRSTHGLRAAGVSAMRAHERLGHATEDRRGSGPLIWLHADDMTGNPSALALITRIGVALPRAQFLITTGTARSARLVAELMPPRTVHQYAPLDAPGPLNRFLKHWRPDAAVFVQGALSPQVLRRTHASGAAMALVNARLSKRALKGWRRVPSLGGYMFATFNLILTPNDARAREMVELNAPTDRVARGVDLTCMTGPLPIDEDALFEARAALRHRPVWVASCTHPGEEEAVLQAHGTLLKSHPDLCLILVPQEPERGDAVTGLIAGAGLSLTRRSRGDTPGEQVFLADAAGELGTWYALSDVVFLGGSLRPLGGHNPAEVAHAGAAVLSGTHLADVATTFAKLEAAGAARLVADADDLAEKVDAWLADDDARIKACTAARHFAQTQTDTLDRIAARLIKALELRTDA